ncbi:hypothetical protein ADINL_0553 [Nitrincola lacisaponensis]|uniref:Uncharacterized protein n=1 Tax=Nitrincola lacisaponensis TaxID=267850 RepID=A0A063Y5E7_9GAMM|nr:hypothetical protein [Nitrincola lacisaponensis]KDE40904.1 hypothetical protein ADINL_0553 [Nitrincola lacisaponensis]
MSLTPSELIPNPTENPDVIEALNLSITKIDDDVIEIPHMTAMGANTFFKMVFIALMLGSAAAYNPGWFSSDGKPGVAYAAIYKMFNREESILSSFSRSEDKNNPGYTRTGMSYENFKLDMLERHGRGIGSGLFAIGFLLGTWILLNIAIANPVRIDRKRRIMYTWIHGQFACIQFPSNIDQPMQVVEAHVPMRDKANDLYNMTGPLNLWLPYPKKNKNVIVSLGANHGLFNAMVLGQPYYLQDFLNDYLASPNPKWLDQLGPKRKPKYVHPLNYFLFHFSRLQFLPQFPFKKRKTEKAIEAFMKNPRTKLYDEYVPYR